MRLIGMGGDGNRANITHVGPAVVANRLDQIVPVVIAGHGEVRQHDVIAVAVERAHRGPHRFGGRDDRAVLLNQPHQQLPDIGVVVDDEQVQSIQTVLHVPPPTVRARECKVQVRNHFQGVRSRANPELSNWLTG